MLRLFPSLLTVDAFVYAYVDMGGPTASKPVSVGVGDVLKVISLSSLTPQHSGSFLNAHGERMQW